MEERENHEKEKDEDEEEEEEKKNKYHKNEKLYSYRSFGVPVLTEYFLCDLLSASWVFRIFHHRYRSTVANLLKFWFSMTQPEQIQINVLDAKTIEAFI